MITILIPVKELDAIPKSLISNADKERARLKEFVYNMVVYGAKTTLVNDDLKMSVGLELEHYVTFPIVDLISRRKGSVKGKQLFGVIDDPKAEVVKDLPGRKEEVEEEDEDGNKVKKKKVLSYHKWVKKYHRLNEGPHKLKDKYFFALSDGREYFDGELIAKLAKNGLVVTDAKDIQTVRATEESN